MTVAELQAKTRAAFKYLRGLITDQGDEIEELQSDVDELLDRVAMLELRLAAMEDEQ